MPTKGVISFAAGHPCANGSGIVADAEKLSRSPSQKTLLWPLVAPSCRDRFRQAGRVTEE